MGISIPSFIILDTFDNPLVVMDNTLPEALHFGNDTFHTYLVGSAYTFTFDVSKIIGKQNKNVEGVQHLKVGNKIAFTWRDKCYYLTILTTDETEYLINVFAIGLSMELVNEKCAAYESADPLSFDDYLKVFDGEGMLTIGRNEVSDKTLSLTWDSDDDTCLARIYSLAESFGAELGFSVDLNSSYGLSAIKLDVYHKYDETHQGMGERRDDIVMEWGRNIDSIHRKVDITNLVTALTPTGSNDVGITDILIEEYDNNGVLEFHSPIGDGNIYAVKSKNLYPSQLINKGAEGYIRQFRNYSDLETSEEVAESSLAELKKISTPDFEYEILGYNDLNIGDSVDVSDFGYKPPIFVRTRVIEQEISWTDKSRCKTTYGNITGMEPVIKNAAKKYKEPEPEVQPNPESDFEIYTDTYGRNCFIYKGTKTEVVIPEKFNGEVITSYRGMFAYHTQTKVTKVTAPYSLNVTDMSYMFGLGSDSVDGPSGSGLQSDKVDISGLKTDNVTDFEGMFCGCKADIIGLDSLNVQNGINFSMMFCSYDGESLKLNNFNTWRGTDFRAMFCKCMPLSLDLSALQLYNGVNFDYMFYKCEATSLKLPIMSGSNAETIFKMFSKCKALRLDVSNFKTPKVTDFSYVFYYCEAAQLIVTGWNTSNATNMTSMFEGCSSDVINLRDFIVNKVIYFTNMFKDTRASTINVASFSTDAAVDMSGMFCNSYVKMLDTRKFRTGLVTTMASMFNNCLVYSLYGIISWNTTACINYSSMFVGCCVPTLDLSSFDFTRVSELEGYPNANGMFIDCLTTLVYVDYSLDYYNCDNSNGSYPSGLIVEK